MFVRTPTIESIPRDDVTVSRYSSGAIGPVSIGEVVFRDELRIECDDVGTGFYVQVPIAGRFTSRHRGVETTFSRLSAAVYRPGSPFAARWPGGLRALCVRIEATAVQAAMATLVGDRASRHVGFDPVIDTAGGYGRAWAELVYVLNRQLSAPGSLLREPLVAAPLADSLVNGFMLAATRTQPEALAAPAAAARPAPVRAAIDLIESDPRAPLTLSVLATHSGVSPRTLQKAFQRHLGISPMEYVRDVRLRRAHAELRAADPYGDSVAAVARRWGFSHLGRFAAAHEARFGQKPLRTLRG
jgi:AraC-like DNA-binding protein